MDILIETDEAAFLDDLDAARNRGKSWKSGINASLKELGRDTRQGHLPLPVVPAVSGRATRRTKSPGRRSKG